MQAQSDHVAGNSGDAKSQDTLVAAMMEPGFYPKPPTEVTHKETHISHIFFAGDLVYKVKKAVRYSFLDYSTLARRRFYLNEELRLNRRLAPSVYLGVMPVSHDTSGWRLGGWAEPAEYTLVMRRLPEKRMLPFLLETHQVTAPMIRELAEAVAKFHIDAEPAKGIAPNGWPAAATTQWRENLADIEALFGASTDRPSIDAITAFGESFLRDQTELLARRAEQGWIRDVHGDLHCDHICFAPEGIQIFDCIEFSPALRRCDLASEVAFLIMDLSVRGAEAMVRPFLARYQELLKDPELDALLPFYQCQRALVRAKVHALRADNAAVAGRYLRAAMRFTWQSFEPFLLIVCGLTGSGKSTLARELGERLGLAVINSDTVRKALAKKTGRQIVPLNTGIYSAAMTEKTYAKMAREAEKGIVSGKGAILDATYTQKAKREKISRLAAKHKIPLLVIHCDAPEQTVRNRLEQRAETGTDISDGRWEIFTEQKLAWQPIAEIPAENRLEIDTDAPLEQLALECEAFLRSRLAPAQK